MENYKIHLAIFLLTWIWSKFDPLQELIELAFGKIGVNNIVNKAVHNLLTCWYCLALWSSFVVLGYDKPLEAIAVSFAAWFVEMIIRVKK